MAEDIIFYKRDVFFCNEKKIRSLSLVIFLITYVEFDILYLSFS
jgi:hypothetical protein